MHKQNMASVRITHKRKEKTERTGVYLEPERLTFKNQFVHFIWTVASCLVTSSHCSSLVCGCVQFGHPTDRYLAQTIDMVVGIKDSERAVRRECSTAAEAPSRAWGDNYGGCRRTNVFDALLWSSCWRRHLLMPKKISFDAQLFLQRCRLIGHDNP